MLRVVGLFTGLLAIALVMGARSQAQPPGVVVNDSESAHVTGACSRIAVATFFYQLCYGGSCSSGGCGCTYDYVVTTPNGFKLNNATPCATSWYCTAQHTTSPVACGGS